MSKRPESVRCENCVFWDKDDDSGPEGEFFLGECHRFPAPVHLNPFRIDTDRIKDERKRIIWNHGWTHSIDWCGEFLETWPGNRAPQRFPTLPGERSICPLCKTEQIIGHGHYCVEMAFAGNRDTIVILDPEQPGGYRTARS